MSARIYRTGHELVATFEEVDDAMACFKGMAYNLRERLIMTTDGEMPQSRPHNCCINSMGEYVLDPCNRSDVLS